MPKVSVIMNVRNGADTLGEAIDSVLAQTFEDWEIVAWDGRSTDGSAERIHAYRDPRIRYFLADRDENLGQARDQALRRARGEWLAFLDQDDVWLPRKLERQLALADESVGLIYGRTVAFYADGREIEYDHCHEYTALPDGDIFEQLFRCGCFISMSSSMISRRVWESIGSIPEEVTITPDYYIYAAVAHCSQARAVPDVVCRYRRHEGSMSHSRHCRIQEECIWLLRHWSRSLPPQLVEDRIRKHYTVAAFQRMRHWNTVGGGVRMLLAKGSPGFLLSRPLARWSRMLQRTWKHPLWAERSSE